MNTELSKQDRLMIITVLAGFILVALAFLMPVKAEAGIRVRGVIDGLDLSVATPGPQGNLVQTGPRSFRIENRVRSPRPVRGNYVWVPGHFETVLEMKNCRKFHNDNRFIHRKGSGKRTKRDHLARDRRGPKAPRHNHYTEVWVPGAWVRV